MEVSRDIFVRFAKLARLSQETELFVSTTNLVVHWMKAGMPGEPSPDLRTALRLRRMTLGQGVKHLEHQTRSAAELTPDKMTELHERATDARNKLIHHFFLNYSEDFSDPGEVERAQQEITELGIWIEKAHYVYSAVFEEQERLLRHVGILADESST